LTTLETKYTHYLGVHLCAHSLPDILFLDLATVCFLKNNPHSNDLAVFGLGNRDCCCFSDFWGGGEYILDLDEEEILFMVRLMRERH